MLLACRQCLNGLNMSFLLCYGSRLDAAYGTHHWRMRYLIRMECDTSRISWLHHVKDRVFWSCSILYWVRDNHDSAERRISDGFYPTIQSFFIECPVQTVVRIDVWIEHDIHKKNLLPSYFFIDYFFFPFPLGSFALLSSFFSPWVPGSFFLGALLSGVSGRSFCALTWVAFSFLPFFGNCEPIWGVCQSYES